MDVVDLNDNRRQMYEVKSNIDEDGIQKGELYNLEIMENTGNHRNRLVHITPHPVVKYYDLNGEKFKTDFAIISSKTTTMGGAKIQKTSFKKIAQKSQKQKKDSRSPLKSFIRLKSNK
jgi:hypothetical protein